MHSIYLYIKANHPLVSWICSSTTSSSSPDTALLNVLAVGRCCARNILILQSKWKCYDDFDIFLIAQNIKLHLSYFVEVVNKRTKYSNCK